LHDCIGGRLSIFGDALNSVVFLACFVADAEACLEPEVEAGPQACSTILTLAMARFRRAQALYAIEDEDVRQALVHGVQGHGQGLEVGRNGDLASLHNLAFEFFG